MFKVECPGCKAPYQVDERRVPSAGLKMRCPKCGTSFQVEPPADARSTAPSPVLGASLGLEGDAADAASPGGARPPLPKKKPAMKGTMIGVAPQRGVAPRPVAPPPEPEIDLPSPAVPRAARPAAPAQDPFADLDLPAAATQPPPKAAMPSDLTEEIDLPSPAVPASPALPRRGATTIPQTPAVAPRPGRIGASDADLPSPRAGGPAPRPSAPRPAVPAPTPRATPIVATPAAAADPFADLDLPSMASAPAVSGRTLAGHADLPAVGGAPLELPSPAPDRARPAPLDLPARRPPAPAADPFGNLDFGAAGTPELDLPATAGGPEHSTVGFDDDLPSPGYGTDLPSPSFGLDLPETGFGTDLPSPSHGMDLPSPSYGDDLPSPSYGDDLPSPSFGEDLPSMSGGVGLPGLTGGSGFGELDLPIVGGELPAPVQAGLPDAAAGLPAPRSDDPFGAPAGGGADPFGSRGADPFGGQAAPDPFGGGGEDPFASAPMDPFGAPPADGAMPPSPFGAPPPARAARGGLFGDSDAAGGEFAPPQEEASARELVRKSGGGTAYGEVNLDGGDGGGGVAIEGDVPSGRPPAAPSAGDASGAEASGGEFVVPDGSAPAASVARARAAAPAAGGAVAEIQAKRRRQRLRVAVVTVVAAALAGGALTLVPSVGPFGSYFIMDQVRRGEYERLLTSASDAAHRAFGSDTYPDAETALRAVSTAAGRARRFKPLAAYSAYTGFARGLRFGGESDVYARAKVALEELAEAQGIDKLDLARAAKAAVDGDLARARQLLTVLSRTSPKDIDIAVVRGEVELKAREPQAALAAWKAAQSLEKSSRTAYGLARATLAAGDVPGAQKLAEQALGANSHHVGARLLLAETTWSTKRDEAYCTKLIEEILAAPQFAGPEERIEAETLLGEIHLNRGRVSQAEQAFGEAIKIAEMLKASARAARALSGLGEALFRAGRYSQAIARFKAGAQADPESVVAQVGVAKSSLQLERLEEARDMLAKLRKSHAKDMDVAYWYGRVQESLGDRKEAEVAYRDAIANGKDDPEAVHAYIALAGVLSQAGQLDAANTMLSEAQKKLPSSPALYKALGRVAMTQGRYGDGLTAFEHALQNDPDDLEAKFLVGTAVLRERQFDKALEIFDAVGKVDRDFPGLALERGILFQESGRTEEALREYESALAKAPNDPDLMLKVGCGKAEAGNGVEAEKLLRKVLEQRQTSAETHFCLGRALMVKHELIDAIKAFERAIQIDPNHAQYHLYVGWACNDAGFIAKASPALKKALELDQGLADAYWQRGVLRVKETRPKDAIADLLKALQLRPSRFEAHADLAAAYYDLGKEDLALAEWQKAIAANPNEATWRFHYGKLLSVRLQNAAAAEQLKKALELAEAQATALPWIGEAHRLAAISLGASPAAIPHWQAYLKLGAMNSPYRSEAKMALKRLGSPWEDE